MRLTAPKCSRIRIPFQPSGRTKRRVYVISRPYSISVSTPESRLSGQKGTSICARISPQANSHFPFRHIQSFRTICGLG